jgi:hypothetical protein
MMAKYVEDYTENNKHLKILCISRVGALQGKGKSVAQILLPLWLSFYVFFCSLCLGCLCGASLQFVFPNIFLPFFNESLHVMATKIRKI